MKLEKLIIYGLTPQFAAQAELFGGGVVGRVVSQSKELYRVITEDSEFFAEVSGKFRYDAKRPSDFPAVGDFVMLDRSHGGNGNGIISAVLTRKSIFERKAAGQSSDTQVVAANIDVVFICSALNNDYNLRRLERYLSIAWNSGAVPVVVLTKADLCEDIEEKLAEVSTVAIGADVILTSAYNAETLTKLRAYLKEGVTAAFIGSSGVGKSTLINALIGDEKLRTADIRGDDKGRHTTTRRELILLPQGGVVIDTPGMREIGIDSADIAKAFADIDSLAAQCRFRDCTHTTEPGCAVKGAIENGEIDAQRLESYLKLKKEARYDGLNSRQIEKEKIEVMFSGFGGIKNARKFIKEKQKREY
jgi:ribosome biogenesis GTPase